MSQPLTEAVVHLIAPASVTSWFSYFACLTEADRVLPVGEAPELAPGVLDSILAGPQRTAVIFSGHDSLLRDLRVASLLREHGYQAITQSVRCARLGYDKFAMKEFFCAAGIATPAWARAGMAGSLGAPAARVVVKQRHGTQCAGTRTVTVGECVLGPGELAERFVDGVEYSVVVYRDQHGVATFPPVWKGPVDAVLTPPWRRMRLCPYPAAGPGLDQELRDVAVTIAEAAGAHGHMEVELLVTGEGSLLALEINPRVSGTMRISAMATGLPIFSMYRLPGRRGHLAATAAAAEVPYDGPPVCDAAAGIFATSRLTVAARDFAGVDEKLRRSRLAGRVDGSWDALEAIGSFP